MSKIVPVAQIGVGLNRQRRSFDVGKISDLASSIEQFGLFHALVVRERDGLTTLVAGERRLRAIQELYDFGKLFYHNGVPVPAGMVPVVTLAELDEDEFYEAELEENVRRVDLEWQEIARARAELHALRQKQNPKQTAQDTSLEVFDNPSGGPAIQQAIVLTQHLADPEVAKAKSAAEAMRVVEKKVRAQENAKLAARVGEIQSPHKLLVADWLTVGEVPPIDVLLTDPPYGMGADEFGDSGGAAAGAHGYADDEKTFATVTLGGLKKAAEACRPNAHAYVFCDFDRFAQIRELFNGMGWRAFRTPLIWFRRTGRVPIPDYGPRRQYECILFARRGDRKVNLIAPDVIQVDADENLGHAAQKPVELFTELLRRSARPGDWVLDPFAGTGTLIPAAHASSCRAFCVEINPSSAGIALSRIKVLSGL